MSISSNASMDASTRDLMSLAVSSLLVAEPVSKKSPVARERRFSLRRSAKTASAAPLPDWDRFWQELPALEPSDRTSH